MPAVTTKFDRTKEDIRKGRKTGSPVSKGSSSMHTRACALVTFSYLGAMSNRQPSSHATPRGSSYPSSPACMSSAASSHPQVLRMIQITSCIPQSYQQFYTSNNTCMHANCEGCAGDLGQTPPPGLQKVQNTFAACATLSAPWWPVHLLT